MIFLAYIPDISRLHESKFELYSADTFGLEVWDRKFLDFIETNFCHLAALLISNRPLILSLFRQTM